MSPFKLWCRRMLGIQEDITKDDLNIAHQLGVQVGIAIGEARGRAGALSELESLLLARRQFDQNYTLDDVKVVKARSVH